MQRETGQVRSLSFDTEALGRAQPWTVHHLGLEYSGEIIASEAVDPAYGEPLEGNVSFRVVFFTVPRRVPSGRIQDPRIAMAVPRRPLDVVWRTLGNELRSIHEASERYLTARDLDAQALRRSMEEREESLRGELTRRYATLSLQGRVYTTPTVKVRTRDIFTEESPASWSNRLASAVLQHTYPSLPFDHGGFPHPLTTDDISALFRGLFQGDGDAEGVVEAFTPGLGLSRRQSAALFDATGCPVVEIIQRALDARGGEMPAQAMLRELIHTHGLTRSLGLLYLMAFVRQTQAEIELGADHPTKSRGGGPFLADWVTWDLVSEVAFAESLADHIGALRLQPSLTWDTILPYATLIVDGLTSSGDPKVVTEQERRLLDALGGMAPEIAGAKDAIHTLETSLGRGASGALDQLESLCAVSSYREFYSVAQETFQGPSGLGEALDLYQRIGRLADIVPAIARTIRYLDEMTFGRAHRELMLERDSVAARIEPDSLIANPSLWSSIEDSYRRLRSRYLHVYVSQHAAYHQEALELGHRLERLSPQVQALVRLNEIPELGEPVGTELPQLFKDVTASFKVCLPGEEELSLDDAPYCRGCQLSLGQEVPRRDAELLVGATERAMQKCNRRLSSHSVRQILAHPTREQLDKFVALVQVADLSALANVLDDEVVGFLRRFLQSAEPSTK